MREREKKSTEGGDTKPNLTLLTYK